ncbi:MAG: rod shape-determining protein RodA [Chryseobacterium sp.]|nr:MAG: rod shape-determining protein RodA [Chryseobacterium sp.]
MKWTEGIDKLGLGLYLAICSFAVANIYSVDPGSGTRQAVWLGISVFVGIIIFFMRNKFFENMAGVFYVVGIVLLAGLFPLGTEVLGQRNWYRFGSISLQPVEFAKIGVSLMLANYISGGDFDMKNRRSQLTILAIIGVPALLVLLIPDVGSLLVFMAFFIALYREGLSGNFFSILLIIALAFLLALAVPPVYVALGVLLIAAIYSWLNARTLSWDVLSIIKRTSVVLLLGGFALASPTILEHLPKHQRERIEVLYKGERAFRDTSGYNLLYSKTAIGSGGLWGKGYREGSVTQGKFVPEQSTDYIFCTVGEEWGFVGSTLLVLAYAIYIARIYYLAERQKSTFNRVFGYCLASVLLMHFGINLGMVMGLFPTVGIPLPYFSYGGSSLLAFSVMTFIFFKLNYTDKNSLV